MKYVCHLLKWRFVQLNQSSIICSKTQMQTGYRERWASRADTSDWSKQRLAPLFTDSGFLHCSLFKWQFESSIYAICRKQSLTNRLFYYRPKSYHKSFQYHTLNGHRKSTKLRLSLPRQTILEHRSRNSPMQGSLWMVNWSKRQGQDGQ